MQCGSGNGHNYGGTFGQPLEGEELVPFEKYILGVDRWRHLCYNGVEKKIRRYCYGCSIQNKNGDIS